MRNERQISVSTVAYDGYPIETAFESMAKLGLALVEPAYIQGYMVFTEDDFEETAAQQMRRKLKSFGLGARAISAHMDLGAPDAAGMLARRLRFTAKIGGRFTITNSAAKPRHDAFIRTVEANIPLAEKLGVIIALENPGHGNTNLIPNAKIGADVIRNFGSPHVCMNYDTSNALTCLEGATRPEQDIDFALPVSSHMHLKDVVRELGRWKYVAVGSGEINYDVLLSKLGARPDISVTLELPLRLRRRFHQDPERISELMPLPEIETAIKKSWQCCEAAFASAPKFLNEKREG